jgi:hypothetical protein
MRLAAARNRAYSRARLRSLRQAEVPLYRANGGTFCALRRLGAASGRLDGEGSLMGLVFRLLGLFSDHHA